MARRKPQQGKPDANQQGIIDALQQHGFSVQRLQSVGGGCPDLLVGYNGKNLLLEVKVPGKKLNEAQENWHRAWRGTVVTVSDAYEAVRYARNVCVL